MKSPLIPTREDRIKVFGPLTDELKALQRLGDDAPAEFIRLSARIVFSILDAIEYCIRQDLKEFVVEKRVIDPHLLKGGEVIFELCRVTGCIGEWREKKYDIKTRIKACRKFYRSLIERKLIEPSKLPPPLKEVPKGFSQALHFRNEITHPKSLSSMSFTAQEAKAVTDVIRWAASLVATISSPEYQLFSVNNIFANLKANIAHSIGYPVSPLPEPKKETGEIPRLPAWVPSADD